jgi:hypothetical protein
VVPEVNETIEKISKAIDLTQVGVWVRKLVDDESGPAGTEMFLSDLDKKPGTSHYWPCETEEVIDVVKPVDIPEGGGLYLRKRGDTAVMLYEQAGRLLPDPLKFELVERDGSCFAPAVIAQEGDALEIDSPRGSRVLVGPSVTLLQHHETEGRRLHIKQPMTFTVEDFTADNVETKVEIECEREMTGAIASWFSPSADEFIRVLRRRVQDAISSCTANAIVENPSAFSAPVVEDLVVGCVSVTNIRINKIEFADPELTALYGRVRHDHAVEELEAQLREIALSTKRAEEQFAIQRNEIDINLINMAEEARILDAKLVEQRERRALEYKRDQQEVMDEIVTYELDREARQSQQRIDIDRKRQELEQDLVRSHSEANVKVLEALQPELVAAIRAAGAQTNFGKVVQHLGPASILQGIGLQDAVKRIVGDEAAGSLLLTGMPCADKPNSGSKRRSAEQ